MVQKLSIGLVLSGGGVRAAAFHAGVLKYLAERDMLKEVVHVSSVSGGSLFTGMVFKQKGYRWPTSSEYLSEFLPSFRKLLTQRSLQGSAVLRLLMPWNWRFLLSRGNVIAQSLEKVWGVTASLNQLAAHPLWSINCTAGETGRRFRFKDKTMGDYELGYAKLRDFKLAKAMAISAAFPGGIGPLVIDPTKFSWEKSADWNARKPESVSLPYSKLHLYDGGVYDNLGLEPMFDMGKQQLKNDTSLPSPVNYLLVSDGGAPFTRAPIPHQLHPYRFKRLMDIAMDQTRNLRVRAFVSYLMGGPNRGGFLGIGAVPKESIARFTKSRRELGAQLLGETWLSAQECKRAASIRTTLARMREADYDLLERHGYETARWTIELMHQ
ncbi:patatin-like phospholipase family protein [Achromobacter denitrificans]